MTAINASSRGSKILVSVRQRTCQKDSVFEAPDGTSLKVNNRIKLKEVKNAEAKNRFRQASFELAPACRKPGRIAPKVSKIEGR